MAQLGAVVAILRKIANLLGPFRWAFVFLAGAATVVLLFWLRISHFSFEPVQYVFLSLFGSFLILTFAANALVRFRSTHDRISLILAPVLPEASGEAAERVSKRVREKLASGMEIPLLTVSAGVSVYRADGDTLEKLLAAVDRALYKMKGHTDSMQSLMRVAVCL